LIEEYWLWDCCKEMPCACGGDLCHSYSSIVYPVVGIFLIGLCCYAIWRIAPMIYE